MAGAEGSGAGRAGVWRPAGAARRGGRPCSGRPAGARQWTAGGVGRPEVAGRDGGRKGWGAGWRPAGAARRPACSEQPAGARQCRPAGLVGRPEVAGSDGGLKGWGARVSVAREGARAPARRGRGGRPAGWWAGWGAGRVAGRRRAAVGR